MNGITQENSHWSQHQPHMNGGAIGHQQQYIIAEGSVNNNNIQQQQSNTNGNHITTNGGGTNGIPPPVQQQQQQQQTTEVIEWVDDNHRQQMKNRIMEFLRNKNQGLSSDELLAHANNIEASCYQESQKVKEYQVLISKRLIKIQKGGAITSNFQSPIETTNIITGGGGGNVQFQQPPPPQPQLQNQNMYNQPNNGTNISQQNYKQASNTPTPQMYTNGTTNNINNNGVLTPQQMLVKQQQQLQLQQQQQQQQQKQIQTPGQGQIPMVSKLTPQPMNNTNGAPIPNNNMNIGGGGGGVVNQNKSPIPNINNSTNFTNKVMAQPNTPNMKQPPHPALVNSNPPLSKQQAKQQQQQQQYQQQNWGKGAPGTPIIIQDSPIQTGNTIQGNQNLTGSPTPIYTMNSNNSNTQGYIVKYINNNQNLTESDIIKSFWDKIRLLKGHIPLVESVLPKMKENITKQQQQNKEPDILQKMELQKKMILDCINFIKPLDENTHKVLDYDLLLNHEKTVHSIVNQLSPLPEDLFKKIFKSIEDKPSDQLLSFERDLLSAFERVKRVLPENILLKTGGVASKEPCTLWFKNPPLQNPFQNSSNLVPGVSITPTRKSFNSKNITTSNTNSNNPQQPQQLTNTNINTNLNTIDTNALLPSQQLSNTNIVNSSNSSNSSTNQSQMLTGLSQSLIQISSDVYIPEFKRLKGTNTDQLEKEKKLLTLLKQEIIELSKNDNTLLPARQLDSDTILISEIQDPLNCNLYVHFHQQMALSRLWNGSRKHPGLFIKTAPSIQISTDGDLLFIQPLCKIRWNKAVDVIQQFKSSLLRGKQILKELKEIKPRNNNSTNIFSYDIQIQISQETFELQIHFTVNLFSKFPNNNPKFQFYLTIPDKYPHQSVRFHFNSNNSEFKFLNQLTSNNDNENNNNIVSIKQKIDEFENCFLNYIK